MRKTFVLLCLVGILLVSSLSWGVQQPFSTAKIIHVERKTRDKVDMYLVNTPVTHEVPYFEITIQLNDTDYSAEYTPRHENEELPDGWVEGSDVPARIEKRALFLKRPDGSELRWSIVKRAAVKKSE